MEAEVMQDQSNQVSQDQGAEEGSHQPAQPAVTPDSAVKPEKGLLDKIREKGNVAPPAVKPSEEAAAAEKAALAQFKANLKFKAAGKEHDVPELLRGVMTDAEKEKYVHSLLSKAHGIEMVQEKLKSVREARDQIHQAYTQVMEPIKLGQEAYKRGDMDTVFSTLRIDPNKVLQWAYEKVQLSQMPPEQRQLHEARKQAEHRAWELERQTAYQSQASLEAQAEHIDQMIDLVLERPDYSSFAQEYDTRKGKQGAFRDLITLMGEQEFNRSGKIISPLEAAKAAVDLLGMKAGAPVQQAAAAPQPEAQPAPAPQKKITLPNVGSAKATAPAKSKPKSIDDLKRIHQQMASK